MWAYADDLVSRFASAAPFAARYISLTSSNGRSVGQRESRFHREKLLH